MNITSGENMRTELEDPMPGLANEAYFDEVASATIRVFDERLLQAPITVLSRRIPMMFSEEDTVRSAVRAMQGEHRGCVLISEDGTRQTKLTGIFTDRDVLLRILGKPRDPTAIPLSDVMVRDPEVVPAKAPVAWVLNKMSVGGFRHVPVVDDHGRPVFVVSVKDVVDFLVDSFPAEILNLPPESGPQRYRTREGA